MVNEVIRKLASIRRIAEVRAIPGADAITAYRVDGWWVVDQIGKYKVGDLAVFVEPDAWVPVAVAPFLCKAVKSFNGVEGERLKTIRLKGQLSQGLLLPLSVLEPYMVTFGFDGGEDVTELLGIQKYEKPMNAQLAGLAKGNFPSFLRKTDQERIQNLPREFAEWKARGLTFEVTEKLDGSSMTVYFKDGKMGVCSRNLELKEDDSNTFWRVAKEGITLEGLTSNEVFDSAIQGELVGPGIQNNPYGLSSHRMLVFDVFLPGNQQYLTAEQRRQLCAVCPNKLKHVPVVATGVRLPDTIAEVLEMADGKSHLGPCDREGVVWKCEQDPSISFKVISNKWLLKEKD